MARLGYSIVKARDSFDKIISSQNLKDLGLLSDEVVNQIDLHYLTSKEAIQLLDWLVPRVETALKTEYILPNMGPNKHILRIVCGNGEGVLKDLVKTFLTERGQDMYCDDINGVYYALF